MSEMNLRKQVPKNLAINILSFGITFLIGIWLTPYLLKQLGVVAYGLIPLAMFLSQYVSVILNSINISIDKFYLESLHKNEDENSNKIFTTSLIIILTFIFFQLLIMAIVLFNITYFFTIPNKLVQDAIWLFGLTFLGFSISLIRGIYGTTLFAYNRLDISRGIDILQNIVRVVIIVSLFILDEVSLKAVGIANLIAAIVAFIPTYYYFKKLTPQIKIKLSYFDKSKVSDISKMSTWIIINQVGVLLLGNIDLYLVNTMIDGKATGEYAIVIQVATIFRTLSGLFAGLITPIVMIYYAKNEIENVNIALSIASKFMAIFISIVLGVTFVFAPILIGIWLGTEYVYLSSLISFSLLFLLFSVPTMPLFSVNVATSKVKIPAVTTIIFGILNSVLMIVLLKATDLGLWAVVIAKLFLELAYNSIFMPIYVSKIMKVKIWTFLRIPFLSVLLTSIVFTLVYFINQYLLLESFLPILSFSIIMFILFKILFSIIIYSGKEKKILIPRLRKRK